MSTEQLEQYITEYGKEVYSFCSYLTMNKDDADDLYQQTFLTAFQKDNIQDELNPKAYLNSIAANLRNNQKRKFLWRRNKADIVYLQSEDMEALADDSQSVSAEIEKQDEIASVRKLVAELPEKMRVVVLMFYMEEMTIEEISAALKIPEGTVKSRLHQAKEKLKVRFDEQ